MWKVLSPTVCRESAEVLQHWLNAKYPIDFEKKVNWGNSGFSHHNPSTVFGNKCEAVERSASKLTFFSLCQDLGTVPVVTSYPGPCFQHFNHLGSNGSGVRFVDREEDFISGILSTKYIKGEEYRAYFCYDMEPLIYKKALLPNAESNPLQTSERYGYVSAGSYLKRVTGLKSIIKELTKKVVQRLELSYGAVDFIMSEDYTVYILESNSAPTLFLQEIVDGFATSIKENLL